MGSTILVIAFSVLPGSAAAAQLVRRLRLGLLEWVGLSLCVTFSLSALVYTIATVLRPSLTMATWILVILILIVTIPSLRGLRSLRGIPVGWGGVIVTAVAGLAAFIGGPWLKFGTDTYYHLAAIRSLVIGNVSVVTDPFHGGASAVADVSAGYTHTLFATLCQMKGADPLYLLWGMTVLGAVGVTLGMCLLGRALMGSSRGGTILGWAYVLFIMFGDFRSMYAPSRLSLAFALIGLAALVWFLRSPSWASSVSLMAAGLAVTAHLGTVLVFVVIGVALIVGAVSTRGSKPLRFRVLTGACALALLLSSTLPAVVSRTVSLLDSTAQVTSLDARADVEQPTLAKAKGAVSVPGGAIIDPDAFFEPGRLAYIAMLGLAVVVLIAGRRERDWRMGAAACAGLVSGVLAMIPPTTRIIALVAPYILWRLLTGISFAAVLPLAGALRGLGRSRSRGLAVAAGIWSVVFLLAATPYLRTVYTEHRSDAGIQIGQSNESVWRSRRSSAVDAVGQVGLGAVRIAVGDSMPMVATSQKMGYFLAGAVPVAVVAVPSGHSPVAIEMVDGGIRREAMEQFLDPATTTVQRAATAREWDVEYVFWWDAPGESDDSVLESLQAESDLLEPVIMLDDVYLWRIAQME